MSNVIGDAIKLRDEVLLRWKERPETEGVLSLFHLVMIQTMITDLNIATEKIAQSEILRANCDHLYAACLEALRIIDDL
mgnify:CR=1 FL=1